MVHVGINGDSFHQTMKKIIRATNENKKTLLKKTKYIKKDQLRKREK